MVEKYINPHTDFGFKRLFGSEFNKELLISFLNAMFHGEQNVQDITYLNSEQLGDRADARRAIFDVYCENAKGEKFIVEMQNVYQEFFKDRTIYYSMFPIREQAQRGGDWDFHLNPVYTIGLLNFNFADGLENATRWHHEVKLMSNSLLNSEPKSRLKPKSVCGLMYFSTITLLFIILSANIHHFY